MRNKPRKTSLGVNAAGKHVALPDQSRDPHILVTGPSGRGKSRHILSVITQRIAAGEGCTVIDPHGDLTAYLKSWCAERAASLDLNRVHFLDADSERHSFGYNVFQTDRPEETAAMASSFASSMATVFGGNDAFATPLLTSIFYSLAVALSENGLSLTEAATFLFEAQKAQRRALTDRIDNDYLRSFWENLNEARPREYMETMGSAERRIRSFLANETARRIFGQQEHTINFRQTMDDGDVVILNLASRSGTLPPETRRLLGTLFVSSICQKAQTRAPMEQPRHHLLVIDECQNFLTSDICVALDQLRKYGLTMLLSTQSLEFIRLENERIYASIVANCATEICFGVKNYRQSVELAWELFGDLVDPNRIKHVLDRPTVVGHRVRELNSGSESKSSAFAEILAKAESESQSQVNSSGRSSGHSKGRGFGQTQGSSSMQGASTGEGVFMSSDLQQRVIQPVLLDTSFSAGQSSGTSVSGAESQFNSESDSVSESVSQAFGNILGRSVSRAQSSQSGETVSRGFSECLEPILRILPSATFSLDEQIHLYAVSLRTLPKRHAYVKLPGREPIEVQALDMPDITIVPSRYRRALNFLKRTTSFLIPSWQAEQEIRERQLTIEFSPHQTPDADIFDEPAEAFQFEDDTP